VKWSLVIFSVYDVLNNSGGVAPVAIVGRPVARAGRMDGVTYVSQGTLSYSPVSRQVRWDAIYSRRKRGITFQVRVSDVVTVSEIQNTANVYYDCGLQQPWL